MNFKQKILIFLILTFLCVSYLHAVNKYNLSPNSTFKDNQSKLLPEFSFSIEFADDIDLNLDKIKTLDSCEIVIPKGKNLLSRQITKFTKPVIENIFSNSKLKIIYNKKNIVRTGLDEALTNAIVHGISKEDHLIWVRWFILEDKFVLEVENESEDDSFSLNAKSEKNKYVDALGFRLAGVGAGLQMLKISAEKVYLEKIYRNNKFKSNKIVFETPLVSEKDLLFKKSSNDMVQNSS